MFRELDGETVQRAAMLAGDVALDDVPSSQPQTAELSQQPGVE
jgi:hypothetical protein